MRYRSVTATWLTYWLGNWGAVYPGTTIKHPYRFVFICGCSSANTMFPEAFGIPKVYMKSADFTKLMGGKGQPRAFLGFTEDEGYSATGSSNPAMLESMSTFVTVFYQEWSKPNCQLQDAVDKATKRANALWFPFLTKQINLHPKIYGCYDLQFDK